MRRYKIIAHLRYWWTRTQSVANAIFGGIRSFLRAPHDAMVRLSPHYRWWHEQPHHVKIHRHIRNFSALVGFAVIFGYSLATYQAIKYTLSPSFVSASGSNKTWSGATDMAEFVSGGNGKVAVESGKLALSGTPGGAAIISSNSDGQHDYNSSPYAQGLFSGVTVTNGYTINHSGIEYNDPNSNCYHQDTSTVISGGNLSEPYCIQGGPDAGIAVGDVVIYSQGMSQTIYAVTEYNNEMHVVTFGSPLGNSQHHFMLLNTNDLWVSAGYLDHYTVSVDSGTHDPTITQLFHTTTGGNYDVVQFTYQAGYIWSAPYYGSGNVYKIDPINDTISTFTSTIPSSTYNSSVGIGGDGTGYALITGNGSWSVQAFNSSSGAKVGSPSQSQTDPSQSYGQFMWASGGHVYVSTTDFGSPTAINYVYEIGLGQNVYTTDAAVGSASYSPGGLNRWTQAIAVSNAPTNTTFSLTYSTTQNGSYVSDITSLSRSASIYAKAQLQTTDSSVTPTLTSLEIQYTPVTVSAPTLNRTSPISFGDSNRTTRISWVADGAIASDHIRLRYSTNSGSSYSDISGATNLAYDATYYDWTMPQSSSSTMRVKVILEDSGNTELASGASASDFQIIYDTTPPTISISSPTDNSTTGTATATITGIAGDANGVASITSDHAGTITDTSIGHDWTAWSQTVTLSSGANTIIYKSHDNAGNESTGATIHITYNSTPPSISITSNSSILTNSSSGSIAGTAGSTGGSVTSVTYSLVTSGGTTTGSASGTTSWSLSPTLVEGSNAFTFTVHDSLGGTNTASITLTLDTAHPTFGTVSATSNNPVSNTIATKNAVQSDLVTLHFTASETMASAPTVTLGGQSMTAGSVDTSDVNHPIYTFTRTIDKTEAEGSAPIVITGGTDLAGNSGTENNSVTFHIDYTPPQITITDPAVTRTANGTIGVAGTASDNDTLDSVTSNPSAAVGGTPASWTQTVSLSAGDNTVVYTAHDGAGNTASATVILTRDNTAPSISTAHMTSTNAHHTWIAKSGDTLTVTFTTSEALDPATNPTVRFPNGWGAPKELAFKSRDGNNYTYSIVIDWWDLQNSVNLNITNLKDLVGNVSDPGTIAYTVDAGSPYSQMQIDMSAPTVRYGVGIGNTDENHIWDIYTQNPTMQVPVEAWDNYGVEGFTSTLPGSFSSGPVGINTWMQTANLNDGDNNNVVTATDIAGNSAKTSNMKIIKDGGYIGPPLDVTATCDNTTCTLGWNRPSTGPLFQGYLMEMRRDPSFTAPTRAVDYSGAVNQSKLGALEVRYENNAGGDRTFRGLTPGTKYYFAVYAITGVLYSSSSSLDGVVQVPVYSTGATTTGTTTNISPKPEPNPDPDAMPSFTAPTIYAGICDLGVEFASTGSFAAQDKVFYDVYRSTAAGERGSYLRSFNRSNGGQFVAVDNLHPGESYTRYFFGDTVVPETPYYYTVVERIKDTLAETGSKQSVSGKVTLYYSVHVKNSATGETEDGPVSVMVGQSVQLSARNANHCNATNTGASLKVTWSLDGDYAKVTPDGILTGLKPGGSLTGLKATLLNTNVSLKKAPALYSANLMPLRSDTNAGTGVSAIKAAVGGSVSLADRTVPVYVDEDNVITTARINPGSATLKHGGTQSFTLTLQNQNGAQLNPTDLGYTVTWTATGGSIDADGQYTAGSTDGSFTVNVLAKKGVEEWRATARITITSEDPYLAGVTMTSLMHIPLGTQGRFLSYAYDQFGNYLNVPESGIRYSNSDPEAGLIDNNGLFYANNKEKLTDWVIRADYTYNGRTAFAMSRVDTRKTPDINPDEYIYHVVFTNNSYKWVFRPSVTHQYSGIVYDQFNNIAPHKELYWDMIDNNAGSVTNSGFYSSSSTEKVYPNSIKLSIRDTVSGVITPYRTYSLVISGEDSRVVKITTDTIVLPPRSYAYASAGYYDQFGIYYPGAIGDYQISIVNGGGNIIGFNQLLSGALGEYRNTIKAELVRGGGGTSATVDQGDIAVVPVDPWPPTVCAHPPCYWPWWPPITPPGPGPGGGGDDPQIVDPPGGQIILPGSLVAKAIAYVRLRNNIGKVSLGIATINIVTLFSSLPSVFSFLNFWPIFSFRKKRRLTGKVLKPRSNSPIIAATVSLLDPQTLQTVDSQRTDSLGQYMMLVSGDETKRYLLKIVAPGFETIEREVAYDEIHQIFHLNLSLEYDHKKMSRFNIWHSIVKLLSLIRVPLLVSGTIMWVWVYLQVVPNWQGNLLGVYYLLSWIIEWYMSRLPRPYGVVTEAGTETPLSLVVVRVADASGRIVATEVTNIRGQFKTLLFRGSYTFTFAKTGYEPLTKTGLVFGKASDSVTVDAEMQKEVLPLESGFEIEKTLT